MSNIYHIKCSHSVSEGEFTSALQDVVSERFGNDVLVEHGDELPTVWGIRLAKSVDGRYYGFEIFRDGDNTFRAKFGSGYFGAWLNFYIRNQLASRLFAVIVDIEDTGDEWEPEPDRFPDYESWLHFRSVVSFDRLGQLEGNDPEKYAQAGLDQKKALLQSTPPELLSL